MTQAVVAIMTYITYDTAWERVRTNCMLKTIEEVKKRGHALVIVDGGSPPQFVNTMEELGVQVSAQEVPSMGNGIRQALRQACTIATDGQAIVWVEPEKYPLVSILGPAIQQFTDEQLDLIMFRRQSLDSYPPEQAMAYQMIALATKYLTGIDSDFGWGPMILSKRAVEYFLNYESDYGDRWDSIHCPKLKIIKEGLPWKIVPIDYRHPPEMTAAEKGMVLFLKRIEQMGQLVRALIGEVDRLGMRK